MNHVKILSIDYSEALALDGVIGKVDANDIPGENEIIVMWQKEHCDKVTVKIQNLEYFAWENDGVLIILIKLRHFPQIK